VLKLSITALSKTTVSIVGYLWQHYNFKHDGIWHYETEHNDIRQNVTQHISEKVLLCASSECRNLTARLSVVKLIVVAPFFFFKK
jgi:hypothetical protein